MIELVLGSAIILEIFCEPLDELDLDLENLLDLELDLEELLPPLSISSKSLAIS